MLGGSETLWEVIGQKADERLEGLVWAHLPSCLASESHHQIMTEKVPGLAQGLVPEQVDSISQEITCG